MGFIETEKFYDGTAQKFEELSAYLVDTYKKKGFEVQTVPMGDNGHIIQMRNESLIKDVIGLSQTLSVTISQCGGGLTISIGKTRWIDKLTIGLLGYIVLPPLLATAGYGAYKQYTLDDEVWTAINTFLGLKGTTQPGTASGCRTASTVCPKCSAVNPEGAKFCSQCGSTLRQACPSCGKPVLDGMKFCPNCGAAANGSEK